MREDIEERKMEFSHVGTEEQVADALRESLSMEAHSKHRKELLNIE